MTPETVVITVKVVTKFDDNAKYDGNTKCVSKKVDTEFDHKCNVKEISTRYCSKQANKCLFKPSIFRLLTHAIQ